MIKEERGEDFRGERVAGGVERGEEIIVDVVVAADDDDSDGAG